MFERLMARAQGRSERWPEVLKDAERMRDKVEVRPRSVPELSGWTRAKWLFTGTLAALALAAGTCGAETAFSGTFQAQTTWQHTKSVGAATLTEALPRLYLWTHSDGTNTMQMNAFVSAAGALAAGASNTVNLAAAVNGFGDAVAFKRVAFMAVQAATNNAAAVRVGGAAADAFAAWAGGADDAVDVRPGGIVIFIAPQTNGYTVGTATNLLIRNTGATNASYTVYLGGVQ